MFSWPCPIVKNMQLPSLPQKEPLTFFCPNCCAMFWNELKINFPIFAILIFELWWFCSQFSCVFTDQIWKKKMMSQKMCNVLKRIFVLLSSFPAILSFWDMIDFPPLIHSLLNRNLKEKFMPAAHMKSELHGNWKRYII